MNPVMRTMSSSGGSAKLVAKKKGEKVNTTNVYVSLLVMRSRRRTYGHMGTDSASLTHTHAHLRCAHEFTRLRLLRSDGDAGTYSSRVGHGHDGGGFAPGFWVVLGRVRRP